MSECEIGFPSSFRHYAKYKSESVKRKWQQGDMLRKSKELFLIGATESIYEPLLGPTHIRLLKLEAGSHGSVIRCSLHHVNLNDRPSYTALSYTWKQDPTALGAAYSMIKECMKRALRGEEAKVDVPQDTGELSRSKEIICDGKVVKIFPNLYNALVQLRRRRPGEYWIDALCINQSDREERAAQVQLMGHIYQSATLVVVWLGISRRYASVGIPHLEHIASKNIKLPSMRLMAMTDKLILPPGLGINAKAVFDAYLSVVSIVMSQWFRRVWIVQELCWARDVIFSMNEMEISTAAVIKAFDIAQEYISVIDDAAQWGDDDSPKTRLAAMYAPIWVPQIQHDPRDLVFAGLSLIKPENLVVDPGLCVAASTLSQTSSPASWFTRRQYYPQIIPPQGTRNASRPLPKETAKSTTKPGSLLPKGLWSILKADYTVDAAEVLVNTAACLLTHTGTKELLSIATRTNDPETYTSEWWLSPGDKHTVEDLPSWAPAPGSWTARLTELFAFQAGSRFQAGSEATNSPNISNDGSALYLDAYRIDRIDELLLRRVFIDEMSFDMLKKFLSDILSLRTMQRENEPCLFGALVRVLISGPEQDSVQLHQAASTWFCQTLTHAVATQMLQRRRAQFKGLPWHFDSSKATHIDVEYWRIKRYGEDRKDSDGLVDLYMRVRAAFPDQNWPDCAAVRSFDRDLHINGLKSMKETQNPDRDPEKDHAILGPELAPSDAELHSRFTSMAKSALSWRQVFVTRHGHIGIGPRWLDTGDIVMLVCGAPVPYAFTPLRTDLGRRERIIRATMDSNQNNYNKTARALESSGDKRFWKPLHAIQHDRREGKLKRLDERLLELQHELHKISNCKHPPDAWVLQGEVYIEGIMHGEAMRDDTVERITIV